ncbi:ABC transporter ATP-binding protein [Rhodohalobacter mucosus]|uniref:ABC transporter ATP-binding protein n=1 Tax=Rhodohalobacter mucosus TaxID=2079485 RepID=A0A316TTQ7_9BACT|nr:ABC transporter ATP-binding protein [Rhodohalobacter mucosus]PWN07820.1 ABC transporter ATP-binding protein [Rhodohalobacter mucosus]
MLKSFKKLLYILPKKDPVKLLILFFLMMIAAVLEVIGIGMIPAFVAIVASPERILELEWIQPVLSAFGISTARELLIGGSLALVAVFLLKSAYIISFNFFEARFIYRRRYTISRRMMKSYMRAPYTFHLQRNTSELLRNIINEVNVVINIVVTYILSMARELVMTVSILLFLFVVEPMITLLIIALAGVGIGSFVITIRKKMKRYGEEELNRREKMIKAVNQGLGGIKDARVLNREDEFIDKFSTEADKSTRLLALLRFIMQIPKPIIETTAVVGMLLISVILVWQGRPMELIIPILTLFAMATVRLMPSIQLLGSQYTNLQYNLVSVDPIYNDLKELEEYSQKLEMERKGHKRLELRERIEIQNVWYSYPESDEQSVQGVSLSIPKGASVAFVGASGAGKTTMVDLLLGLLEPGRGSIRVDGTDIREDVSSWQKNIGYIPQSIYLADETLRSNIAFGLPEKEIDDEKVMEAVKLAQLEEMVSRMPEGLDTIIGENGTRISGGQRQRVGIARALYHNPDVLVMDEATSALDNITEKYITEAIDALKGDRTIIMIAHRLTTVQNCDVIYFMENGRIEQAGSYRELIETNRHFREMALEG